MWRAAREGKYVAIRAIIDNGAPSIIALSRKRAYVRTYERFGAARAVHRGAVSRYFPGDIVASARTPKVKIIVGI